MVNNFHYDTKTILNRFTVFVHACFLQFSSFPHYCPHEKSFFTSLHCVDFDFFPQKQKISIPYT